MRSIKFIERREFDYGDGLVVHEVGSVATLRDDKAQRWVTRNAAVFVEAEEAPAKVKDVADDNPVGSPQDVGGSDGGDSGQRPVDDATAGQPPAPAPEAKPAQQHGKPGRRGHK